MMYELADWDSASFLTLNYSDDYFAWLTDKGRFSEVNNLSPQEVSAYWKRVRRSFDYYYDDWKGLKHYTSAEYGPKTGRAHYHAIVYGVNPHDDDHRDILKFAWNEKRAEVPRNEDFQWLKSRGPKSAVKEVLPESIRYVASYVQKKLGGKMAKDVYGDRQPPFSRMSKGLGLHQASLHLASLQKGWTYLPGGQKIGIPRYFRDKFDIDVTNFDDVGVEKEERDFLWKQFEKEYDVMSIPISRREPLFQGFCSKWRDGVVDKIWEDYQQRAKLKGGQ